MPLKLRVGPSWLPRQKWLRPLQNDLNALLVQGFYHVPKFVDRADRVFGGNCSPGGGAKKSHGAVAPVVFQSWAHVLGIKTGEWAATLQR